jgi:SAM-dependent methyltransferase
VYDFGWGDFSIKYVDFINDLLYDYNLARARILDLACGTGILAIELAQRGHFVKGIDVSPEMIQRAKSKSSRLPNVSFDVADMTQFEINDTFDLVICTFDSINYIMRAVDLRKMFARVAASLDQKRFFIFDSNTRQLYRNHHQERQERELGGQSFVQECTYDPRRNEAAIRFIFSDGTEEVHKQRPYNLKELEPLLSAAQFEILNVFSWFDRRPYSSKTEKLFCVAQKA